MTVISLVQSNIIRRRSSAHKEAISQKQKARRLLAVVLIFSIFLFLFLYVLEVNTITAKGYDIRSFKKQINELKDKNKQLQVNISNFKSINFLQSRTETFDMVKAQSIDYVTVPPSPVVVAK